MCYKAELQWGENQLKVIDWVISCVACGHKLAGLTKSSRKYWVAIFWAGTGILIVLSLLLLSGNEFNRQESNERNCDLYTLENYLESLVFAVVVRARTKPMQRIRIVSIYNGEDMVPLHLRVGMMLHACTWYVRSVQFFPSPPVVLPSFISRFALIR